MIAKIARPLTVLAAIGWTSALCLSAAELAGVEISSRASEVLGLALAPLFLTAIVLLALAFKASPYVNSAWWFTRALNRSPKWVRYASGGTTAFVVFAAALSLLWGRQTAWMEYAVLSMLFVFPLVALSTASISPTCSNGHHVGPFEQYCHSCGEPMVGNWDSGPNL